MEYTLKKELVVNHHKTLPAGVVMDVTEDYAQWLDDNGYGKEEKKKVKKETKTKENKASEKEQDNTNEL